MFRDRVCSKWQRSIFFIFHRSSSRDSSNRMGVLRRGLLFFFKGFRILGSMLSTGAMIAGSGPVGSVSSCRIELLACKAVFVAFPCTAFVVGSYPSWVAVQTWEGYNQDSSAYLASLVETLDLTDPVLVLDRQDLHHPVPSVAA